MYFLFLETVFSVCCAYVADFLVVRNRSEMEGFEWGGCCMMLVNTIGLSGMG